MLELRRLDIGGEHFDGRYSKFFSSFDAEVTFTVFVEQNKDVVMEDVEPVNGIVKEKERAGDIEEEIGDEDNKEHTFEVPIDIGAVKPVESEHSCLSGEFSFDCSVIFSTDSH